MAQPYPISRQSREQAVELGSGVATYGPFNFQIFDIEDVEVWTQPVTGGVWTLATVSVTKTTGAPLDTFSITFPAAISATTRYKVLGKRIYERSAGVTKGTRLDPDALEKELSKLAATLQELRRDVGRGIQVQFGAGYIMSDNLADGATLVKSGGRVVEGPNASQIAAAQAYATDAFNYASAAALSAAAAATFNPVNFYTKAEANGTFATISTTNALNTALGGKLGTSGELATAAFWTAIKWRSLRIGEVYFASTNLSGADVPPVSDADMVFIELTAGLTGVGSYNNGKLTSESVSGSAPLVLATAVISVAGSPMNGQTVRLLNTEGRILRPSTSPGTLQDDAMQGHLHGVNGIISGASIGAGSSYSGGGNSGSPVTDGTNGTPRTANETRMKNVGVRAYMRIK